MSTAIAIQACSCGSIGADPDVVRQCPEHFHIWRGDRRLASVGSIIRTCWPPPAVLPPPDVLENARDRGDVVDKLFAAYVRDGRVHVPAGTRTDAVELLRKLIRWFDKQNFQSVETQVLLGGEDYGGVLDFRF